MSILHFEFTPRIAFFEPDVDQTSGLEQIEEVTYPTDRPGLNQAILKGLQEDKIRFKDNVQDYMDVFHYEYKPTDNRIHIWGKTRSDQPMNPELLGEMLYGLSPDGGGPDGWMEGDINIVPDNIASEFGGIELHPYISRVGVLVPQANNPGFYTEYDVDINALPHS